MKILGEQLRDIGRWYIALPPLLLIAFLVALFFFAAAAQSRLLASNERLHAAQLRQQALSEFMTLLTDAESGQRGYLLTGESAYLRPDSATAFNVAAALDRVAESYGADTIPRELHELRVLTAKKLAELEDNLTRFNERLAAPAVSVSSTDVGKRTMDEISTVVGTLRRAESRQQSAATAQWQRDFLMSRLVSAVGVVLNIGLVLLATYLVYGDMRRRARLASNLGDQKRELELQIDERTRELRTLSTHLQGVSEEEKSALSRELHDELGGLLVAARMDLSWLQQRLPTTDAAIEQRFKRIHESLSAGVDLKRRVVEELRPTLLDNMGLFTALRWQFKETCRRAGLTCTETIPELDIKFHPDAAIGLFRIAQEALTNILKHAEATSADLMIGIEGDTLLLRVSDNGKGIPPHRLQTNTSHGLAAMRHRIAALGGTWEMRTPSTGGTILTALIPLSIILPDQPPIGEAFD